MTQALTNPTGPPQQLGSSMSAKLLAGGGFANLPIPLMEYVRLGCVYKAGCFVAANGIAPVQDYPTTTAGLGLYNNNDPSTNRCLVVIRAGFCLTSGTAVAGATLIGHVPSQPVADAQKPTANQAGYGFTNLLGGRPDNSGGLFKASLTIPAYLYPSGGGWFNMQSQFQIAGAVAAQLGEGYDDTKDHFMIIPPRYAAGFGIISSAGTSPLYSISLVVMSIPLVTSDIV